MVPAEKLPSSYQWETDDQYYGYEPPQHRPRRRIKRRRRRLPATLKLCLLGALVVVLGVLYLSQQLDTMYLSLELTDLQQEVNLARQRNGHLRVQLEQVRSLQTVEEIARTKLGMVDPSDSPVLMASNIVPRGYVANDSASINPTSRAEDGPWTVLASWLNKLFPVGGVEAGKL